MDDEFADLAFRLGRCYAARGKTTDAKQQYVRARDLDSLRFRTDTNSNDVIRAVAAAHADSGVVLADAERTFERSSPDGLPGEELFHEHVHMTFKGNYVLARTIFACIEGLAPPALGACRGEKVPPLSEQQCAERLAYTPWHALKIAETMLPMLAMTPPFTSQLDHRERGKRWLKKVEEMKSRVQTEGVQKLITATHNAVAARKEDWMMPLTFAHLLSECRAVRQAEEQFEAAVANLPHNYVARLQLAQFLLHTGRVAEANMQFRETLRFAPDYMEAHFGLASALAAQGDKTEARAICEEQLRKGSNRLRALAQFADFLLQTGDRKEAEERVREVLRMTPYDTHALQLLGNLELARGKVDEAIEHYQAALRIWPDWPAVRDQLDKARKLERKAP